MLKRGERLRAFVIQRLSEGWFPEQIASRLRKWSEGRAFSQRLSRQVAAVGLEASEAFGSPRRSNAAPSSRSASA